MTGEIIIENDENEFKQGMKHEDAKKLGNVFSTDRKDMTMKAKLKTVYTVLAKTQLPDGSILGLKDIKLSLNSDPNNLGVYNFNYSTQMHEINLDLQSKGWTVENIRLTGGIHEYFGHGIKGWGDRIGGTGGTHRKIYALEMDSKYWEKATSSMKGNIVRNYYRYSYWETNSNAIPKV